MKHIAIGCDHIAVPLKESVINHLHNRGIEVLDVGTFSSDVIVDYPDYAQKVALAIIAGEVDAGIVICGTGLGVSIAANKIKGVRAALCHDTYTAHQARAHNDANVLALGAWIVSPQRMGSIVDEWLDTPFEGGRHTARVNVLDRFLDNPRLNKTLEFNKFQFAVALSLRETSFGPVLFSGRIEDGLISLSKAGFRFVEISIRNAEDIKERNLDQLLNKYGIKVTALATGQGCIHDKLCFTTLDPDLHTAAVQRFKKIIDSASELDAGVIFGGVRGKLSSLDNERNLQVENVMKSLNDCDRYAMERGVPLFFEPINRYETNFANTASEALDFLDKTGTQNTKLLLDSFHMNIEEVDLPMTVRSTGQRLGYFHIVDSNRQSPGQGHIEFEKIIKTLMQIGYAGPISAEILPLPDDESAVVRTGNFLEMLGEKFS